METVRQYRTGTVCLMPVTRSLRRFPGSALLPVLPVLLALLALAGCDRTALREERSAAGTLLRRESCLETAPGVCLPHGLSAVWHANGRLASLSAAYRGERRGWSQEWDETGRLRSRRHYRNGLPDGPHREWFPDGTLRLEERFSRGRLHGERREWFGNGRPKSREFFVLDIPRGAQQWFDREGRTIFSIGTDLLKGDPCSPKSTTEGFASR